MGKRLERQHPLDEQGEKQAESTDDNKPSVHPEATVDPANEYKGTKLLLIHIAICLCNFLVGLVRVPSPLSSLDRPLNS